MLYHRLDAPWVNTQFWVRVFHEGHEKICQIRSALLNTEAWPRIEIMTHQTRTPAWHIARALGLSVEVCRHVE